MHRVASSKILRPNLSYCLSFPITYEFNEQLRFAGEVKDWLNSSKNPSVEACSLLEELVTLTSGRAGTHCAFIFNTMQILQRYISASDNYNGEKDHVQLWANHLMDIITQLVKFLEPNKTILDYPPDKDLMTARRVVPFQYLFVFVDAPYFRSIILNAVDKLISNRHSLELKSIFLATAAERLVHTQPGGWENHPFYDSHTGAIHTTHGVCMPVSGQTRGHIILLNGGNTSNKYGGRAFWVTKDGGITDVDVIIDNTRILRMFPTLHTPVTHWNRACPARHKFGI